MPRPNPDLIPLDLNDAQEKVTIRIEPAVAIDGFHDPKGRILKVPAHHRNQLWPPLGPRELIVPAQLLSEPCLQRSYRLRRPIRHQTPYRSPPTFLVRRRLQRVSWLLSSLHHWRSLNQQHTTLDCCLKLRPTSTCHPETLGISQHRPRPASPDGSVSTARSAASLVMRMQPLSRKRVNVLEG